MNNVQIMGRICNDLALKQTPNGISVTSFNVAVDRYAGKDAEKKTDFIPCVAWRQTAEHICRYWTKGDEILIQGNLQTRTYDDKNGTKHYVTEVIIDRAEFTHGKKGQNASQQGGTAADTSSAPPESSTELTPTDEDYPF